ncbi:hypothetical protein SRHO_G00283710 [Serrasalmus rhombeus]
MSSSPVLPASLATVTEVQLFLALIGKRPQALVDLLPEPHEDLAVLNKALQRRFEQAHLVLEKAVQEELVLEHFLNALLPEEPRWHVKVAEPASRQAVVNMSGRNWLLVMRGT